MFFFTRRRILLIGGALLNLIIFFTWIFVDSYYPDTVEIPASGGRYIEGMLGKPYALNPLIEISDVDRSADSLIYSGLLKRCQDGGLVYDLAQGVQISNDGLQYDVYLRQDVFFHDGTKFTADDVLFTIQTLQAEGFESSQGLKQDFTGVDVQKIDSYHVRFVLSDAYAPFLENLTLGILPQHYFTAIKSADIALANFNVSPVGTGPYRFDQIQTKDSKTVALILKKNPKYYGDIPYIDEVEFRFFTNEQDLVTALKRHEIHAISSFPIVLYDQIKEFNNVSFYAESLPRYQAVFFNVKSQNPAMNDALVRKALSLAIDRNQLIDEYLKGYGDLISGPYPQTFDELGALNDSLLYSPEESIQILGELGYKDTDNDGFLDKDGEILRFSLMSDDNVIRRNIAFSLKEMWLKIGVKVDVRLFGASTFNTSYLTTRNYDSIIYGQNVGSDPDVYAFWHSSQIQNPGQNLSQYESSVADKYLENGRRLLIESDRMEQYSEFSKLLKDQYPAIFIFSPQFVYVASDTIHGVAFPKMEDPRDRFTFFASWNIETERVDRSENVRSPEIRDIPQYFIPSNVQSNISVLSEPLTEESTLDQATVLDEDIVEEGNAL